MEKYTIESTLLFQYLSKDLEEFGIKEEDIRSKIVKNSLDPQNYKDIDGVSIFTHPFLETANGFLFSKKELFIRNGIFRKIEEIFKSFIKKNTLNTTLLLELFDKLRSDDKQKLAIETSLNSPFFILTGGPGTGKTTTAAGIIIAHILAGYSVDSISITAPTGRAAGRITESLQKSFKTLYESKLYKEINYEVLLTLKAGTIHRLLSYSYSRDKFFKNSKNPLDSKLILLDEASMVSPELFFSLLDAIPEGGKIILLGDPDQLPPVDSQKFFKPFLENKFISEESISVKNVLKQSPQSENSILQVALVENHRAGSKHLIDFLEELKTGKLTQKNWISDYENTDLLDRFSDETNKNSNVYFLDNQFFKNKKNTEKFLDAYKTKILNSNLSIEIKGKPSNEDFNKIEKQQILCSLKQSGFTSSDFINNYLESKFRNSPKLLPRIMTYNNYTLGIFNGDMGSEYNGKVYFPIEGVYQTFPKNLSGLESAFAITVHKSQGSQYENVILILPDDTTNELNTRAMLYTGASRTKKNLLIIANQTILDEAVRRI